MILTTFHYIPLAVASLPIFITLDRHGREHNPVLRWMFERVGTIPTLAVVKLAFVAYKFIQYRRIA